VTFAPSTLGLPARFQHYRPKQLQAVIALAADTHRWSLLQASTGSGKTLISVSLNKLLGGRALMLTGTRALQTQAVNDFSEHARLIQGAANYRCLDTRNRRTCEYVEGDKRCPYRNADDGRCTHQQAQQLARDSDLVIGNYAVWTTMGRRNPDALGAFDLLLCDEAHDALSWLTDACALDFTAAELHAVDIDTPPVTGDANDWFAWSLVAIEQVVNAYRNARDGGATPKRLAELTELGKRLRQLSDAASGVSDEVWVGEPTRGGCRYLSVWPARHAERLLWRGIPRVVLSSATLTHEDARHLGLSRADNDYSFHEVDAGFDPKRCPLYYLPVARVDKDIGEGSWRLVVNEFDRFIGSRLKLGRRGVIQATSYEWAQRVVNTSKYAGQMVTHSRHNSRDTVAAFTRGDGPPVLVSPVVKEGHDFIDDIARWTIVVKVPFPSTLSPVTAARCRSDKGYRAHLAGRTMEQMCGRIRRSHADFGEVLVCDSHFGYMRGKQVFTKSFRATWQQVDAVPPPLEL
jgi:Rad3-related DNA helicase